MIVLVEEARPRDAIDGVQSSRARLRRGDPRRYVVSSIVTSSAASPDLLLVTLVAVALLRGSIFGAVAGFFAGLVVDTATLETLGLTSLLLTLVGYWIGRYGETTGRDRAHAPLLSVAVVTVLYALGSLALRFVLGEPAPPRASCSLDALPPGVALNLLLDLARLRGRAAGCCPPPRTRPAPGGAPALASTRRSTARGRVRRASCRRDPRVDEPVPADPEVALRVGDHRPVALVAFARPLPPPVVAAGAVGDAVPAAEAQNNQLRNIRIDAPRGPIWTPGPPPRRQRAGSSGPRSGRPTCPKTRSRERRELRRLAQVLDDAAGATIEARSRRTERGRPAHAGRRCRVGTSRDQVAYIDEHQTSSRG